MISACAQVDRYLGLHRTYIPVQGGYLHRAQEAKRFRLMPLAPIVIDRVYFVFQTLVQGNLLPFKLALVYNLMKLLVYIRLYNGLIDIISQLCRPIIFYPHAWGKLVVHYLEPRTDFNVFLARSKVEIEPFNPTFIQLRVLYPRL